LCEVSSRITLNIFTVIYKSDERHVLCYLGGAMSVPQKGGNIFEVNY